MRDSPATRRANVVAHAEHLDVAERIALDDVKAGAESVGEHEEADRGRRHPQGGAGGGLGCRLWNDLRDGLVHGSGRGRGAGRGAHAETEITVCDLDLAQSVSS